MKKSVYLFVYVCVFSDYTNYEYTLQLIFINKPKTRYNKSSQDKKRRHSTTLR